MFVPAQTVLTVFVPLQLVHPSVMPEIQSQNRSYKSTQTHKLAVVFAPFLNPPFLPPPKHPHSFIPTLTFRKYTSTSAVDSDDSFRFDMFGVGRDVWRTREGAGAGERGTDRPGNVVRDLIP